MILTAFLLAFTSPLCSIAVCPMVTAPSAVLLIAAAPSPVSAPVVTSIALEEPVRKQFVDLAGKKDHDGCLALWKAHPGDVLGTIDADLEGSLRVREKAGSPDLAKIADMHARALWGAAIAYEASGHPMIQDYASSFVGWDEAQRKSFRGGQAAFGKAMDALKKNDAKAALAAGNDCLQRAAPLGDWWGTAMGYHAIAVSQQALGENEKALEAASQERTIYHDLGLAGDEYSATLLMVDLCESLDRPARGKIACERALEMAKRLGDADGEKQLATKRDAFDAKLKAAAEAKKPAEPKKDTK
jgi:hypothetical protein